MARKRKGNPVHGWVVLDKPYGLGSTSAVGKVRWLFQAQKAGHAGTLDPLASGILPIALGEATKTVPFMIDAAKSYEFELSWGANTMTQDAEGEITETSDNRPAEAEILAALPQFIGDIEQVPPKFSAIKIDGKRAYDLARAGEEVEIKPRPVRVEDVRLLAASNDAASFAVDCGKGTYIRSLARDLAAALGTCGHVTALRRTRVGPFTLQQSITLAELEQTCDRGAVSEALYPLSTALDDIPVLAVADQDANDLRHGRAIDPNPSDISPSSDWVLAMEGKREVALCEMRDGRYWPKRVFNL
ncbi:tRNA pseudouridine(55) synthase TruB [Litorimonas sp.]|uniref:tRNA pseudouridine(55) synthase TruB n=1 Tax=Litorimonas sp. TaxID=1892381 RepID=UPI003A835206